MKKYFKSPWLYLVLALALGLLIGRNWQETPHQHSSSKEEAEATTYTCSMHPQIRQEEPGNCPICGMELIPVESKQSGIDPSGIHLSETAQRLANVQTITVSRGKAQRKLSLTGQVKAAADAVHAQVSNIPGRLEKLYVEYPGQTVRQGTVVAQLYSPALVQAQTELQEAFRLREEQPGLYQAARRKMKNWQLSSRDIDRLLHADAPADKFPIRAIASGVVRSLAVQEGDYLKAEQRLFTLVDLTEVWVELDLHEGDLAWVNLGDSVSVAIKAFPAKTFQGKVTYIDPLINPQTQVAKARVVIENDQGRLKPEMIAQADVFTKLSTDKDFIAIPKSAVLWTGKRSIVYSIADDGTYHMREVSLAGDLGSSYLIADGLKEGQEIVANGVFTVDAAAQLAGKPSMMNSSEDHQAHDHEPGQKALEDLSEAEVSDLKIADQKPFNTLIEPYLQLTVALSDDDESAAQAAVDQLNKKAQALLEQPLTGAAKQWQSRLRAEFYPAIQAMDKSPSMAGLRSDFKVVSEEMVALVKDLSLQKKLYVQFCPMADQNQGGFWLSTEKEIANPYFGAMMYSCGSVVEQL